MLQGAIAIADTAGIGALTIRSLAQELGVKPMAIYYHVANKTRFSTASSTSSSQRSSYRRPAVTGAQAGAASELRAPGSEPPPLGDRVDGITKVSRPGDPATPRRGPRHPAGRASALR